ncbi:hypothetical protein J4219_08435 [Candidatus Woesearchaeota archaeon]|nr:hypothetical protein [Candidatus Woesearchaeota archaeon]
MDKRGIELQFHWIFVMVAGALILVFFISVANKQSALSQERLQLTLASDVENIFTGAIVSRGAAQRLPIPPQGLSFECSQGCDCRFMVGKAARPFGDKPLFAPSELKDQDVVVWALELKLPYRVTNLLYLTNPNVKYYLVDPKEGPLQSLHAQFVKSIPPLIHYDNITLDEIPSLQSEDYPFTKFIFFDSNPSFSPPSLDGSFRREEFSAVKLDSQGINFYRNSGSNFVQDGYVPWTGMASAFAAMFAQDRVMYECSMQTVFRKLSYLSGIYSGRAKVLSENAVETGRLLCAYEGDDAVLGLLERQNVAANKVRQGVKSNDLRELTDLASRLEAKNRELVQQSCAGVF